MALWQSPSHNWSWSKLFQPTLSLLALTYVFSLLSSVHADYFLINQPSGSTSWANGSPYPFSWSKGLLDGIDAFDVELARLAGNGRTLIAQNVPAKFKVLNILLQDVPMGDDYFLVCFNSSNSLIHAVSSRFTITDSTSGQSNPNPSPSVPTVTASGPPDPLKQFAATLGPSISAAERFSPNVRVLGFGGILALLAAFLGGAMTLW